MGVREKLSIGRVAGFGIDTDDVVHITDIFGDSWCTDEVNPETNELIGAPELDWRAPEPESEEDLCGVCLVVAREQE